MRRPVIDPPIGHARGDSGCRHRLARAADPLRRAPANSVDVRTCRNGKDQQAPTRPLHRVDGRRQSWVSQLEDAALRSYWVKGRAAKSCLAYVIVRYADDHGPAPGVGEADDRLSQVLQGCLLYTSDAAD